MSHQTEGPGKSAADPGRTYARDDIVGARIYLEPASVTMLEPYAVRHVQFFRTLLGCSEEHLADIDPQTLDVEPCSPSTQHLPFAAREIELMLAGLEPTDFTEKHEFLVVEGIEDSMFRFGNLVLSNDIHWALLTLPIN